MQRDQKYINIGATILLGSLLVFMLPRCDIGGPAPIEYRTVEWHLDSNRVTIGNRIVEIRPGGVSIGKESSSLDDQVIVTSGATRVIVKGDQLSINGESYGTIADDAYVLVVDADVYVDTVLRRPRGSVTP